MLDYKYMLKSSIFRDYYVYIFSLDREFARNKRQMDMER